MAAIDKSSPAAIFERTLVRIEQLLRRAKRSRAFKDDELAFRLRGELFKLEGWAKLHRHWPIKKELKIFQRIREQAKQLEDAFGELEVARVISDDLRAKAQLDLAAMFDERAKKARQNVKHILKTESWFVTDDGETRIEKIRRHLASIDWPNAEIQFDYLRVSLIKDLGEVSEKYRTHWKPELLKPVYDRKILEHALHEWRRQLRWFSMYFQTANGLFGLAPIGQFLTLEKKKLLADFAENPFAQLPTKRTTRAFIDRIAFYELTRLIGEIGVAKDKAERYFQICDLLIKRGESDARASDRVKPLYGDAPLETPPETLKIMGEYEKFKPLAYISETL